MADNLVDQFGSLVKLPGQAFKTSQAKGDLYDVKKKLKVALNKKDPMYGKAKKDPYPSYKKGGKVKKTGLAKLHKGERVLTKGQAKKYNKKK